MPDLHDLAMTLAEQGKHCGYGVIIHPTAEIGEGTIIDEYCIIKAGVKIGKNCRLYPQVLIMPDTTIGDNCIIGDGASIREGCTIGKGTTIGSKVRVECHTKIGNFVSIETQSHITAFMTIEDYVFIGGAVMSTNDMRMRWKREGHGENLKGATLKRACRIGSGAILLPAIVIGEGSVINIGEVVRKDVPPNCLFFTKRGREIYKPIKSDPIKEAI